MIFVTVNGASIEAPEGILLSELLREDHHLELPCNGRGSCGKCAVRAEGALSEPTDSERAALGERLNRGWRLACQARALGSCTVLTRENGDVQVQTHGELRLSSLSPVFTDYGMAVDIGTTTLAARLYGKNGELLAVAGERNPQGSFGADVMSRIEASMAGHGNELARLVRNAISHLAETLALQAGISAAAIDGAVITGNTVMLCLLTNHPTHPLSHAPFQADRLFGEWHKAGALGIQALSEDATVYLPPCISAFVGADSTCALLAAEADGARDGTLLADIGTNGEILLRANDRLLCCSTAAGPAFEGAGIACGMLGRPGAIDHVSIVNGKLHYTTVGEQAPQGICGSGLFDAVACLLRLEELDETGLLEEDPYHLSETVYLTQSDIRAVQLAKSAVCAGIRTLLLRGSASEEQIDRLLIAGGFGSFLDLSSAAEIGLFPPSLRSRVQVLGNAALTGACALLLDRDAEARVLAIAKEAESIDLSTDPYFMDRFVEGMFFE
ncbi:MAG: DUF4445 domain-containing protein [Ruminococcaceae bacterium]|nr:DUF4445 domain-containing protein [Oscillospiraceae bacterium]